MMLHLDQPRRFKFSMAIGTAPLGRPNNRAAAHSPGMPAPTHTRGRQPSSLSSLLRSEPCESEAGDYRLAAATVCDMHQNNSDF